MFQSTEDDHESPPRTRGSSGSHFKGKGAEIRRVETPGTRGRDTPGVEVGVVTDGRDGCRTFSVSVLGVLIDLLEFDRHRTLAHL